MVLLPAHFRVTWCIYSYVWRFTLLTLVAWHDCLNASAVIIKDITDNMSKVSCQKGPIRHAYARQIGPFGQDTLDVMTNHNTTKRDTCGRFLGHTALFNFRGVVISSNILNCIWSSRTYSVLLYIDYSLTVETAVSNIVFGNVHISICCRDTCILIL